MYIHLIKIDQKVFSLPASPFPQESYVLRSSMIVDSKKFYRIT